MKKTKEHYIWFVTLFIIFFSFSIISKKFITNPQEELLQILNNQNCIKQALFPSKNNITQIMIDLIKNEKRSIKAAVFLITDKQIANALIEAKSRNIDIEIITCHTNLNTVVSQLIENNIYVYIFGAPSTKKGLNNAPIMHDKFFVFEQNIDNKSILWTGSFNLTCKAQIKNKENVLILEDKYLISQYLDEFEKIKKESKLLLKHGNKRPEKNLNNRKMTLAEKFKETFRIFTE